MPGAIDMKGENGSFINPSLPIGRGNPLAVMRINREGTNPDAVLLLWIAPNVVLGEYVLANHAPAFPDIEGRRPAFVFLELVIGQGIGRKLLANGLGHHRISSKKPDQFQGILFVCFPDFFTIRITCLRPCPACPDQAG